MERFKYKPLKTDDQTIRVIKVEPLTSDCEHLSCTLDHVSLHDEETNFIALSHVWGIDYRTIKILINGQSYHVQPQLWHFLILAAERIPGQPLWIDAICIDQSRPVEKAIQIPMMGQIYTRAVRLIAWLWSPLDGITAGGSKITASRREAASMIADVSYDISNAIAQCSEVSQALLRLVFHKYWSRVWIVQEVRLSREREFWWEGQRITTSRLEEIATSVSKLLITKSSMRLLQDVGTLNHLVWERLSEHTHQRSDINHPTLFNHTQKITSDGSREFDRSNDRFDLAETVIKYKDFKCGLRADHVFGFLGIAKHGNIFHVEYGMIESDFLVQIWQVSQQMDYRILAGVGRVLDIDWSSKVMHRVHVPWYTELDTVLQSLQALDPSLQQSIADLKLIKSSPAKANSIIMNITSTTLWLPKFHYSTTATNPQASNAQLLAEVTRLVKDREYQHALKIPSLGMYYFVQSTSKDGHAKVRKMLKVTSESKSLADGQDSVLDVAIVELKADSQYTQPVYLRGNVLLSLVSNHVSGLTPSGSGPGRSHGLKTLSMDLSPETFLELLRMSKDTHSVWQGALRWKLPVLAVPSGGGAPS